MEALLQCPGTGCCGATHPSLPLGVQAYGRPIIASRGTRPTDAVHEAGEMALMALHKQVPYAATAMPPVPVTVSALTPVAGPKPAPQAGLLLLWHLHRRCSY
jgi:hypothetical protein